MIPEIHHSAGRPADSSITKKCTLSHESVTTGETSLSCLGCGKSFRMKSELLIHLRSHTSVTFTCSECGESYTDKNELVIHQRSHKDGSSNGNPPERCPLPLYSQDFTQEDHTIPHYDHQSKDPIYMKVEVKGEEVETDAGDDQRSRGKFEMIVKSEQEENISTDGRVPNTIEGNSEKSSKETLTMIPEIHHSAGRPADSSITKKSTLSHESVTISETSLSCLGCGKSFRMKSELLIHLRSHTSVTFTCSECGESYTDKNELVIHQRSHKDPSNPEESSSPHEGDHRGDNLFSCLGCGKSFKTNSELRIHLRSHTRCGRSFTVKAKFLAHQRSHMEESLFSCSDCGKSFSQKAQLLAHQKSHTGKHPFPCPVCGICFSDKANLHKHQRSHTSERPFACSECGKCFTRKENLIKHQRKHT
ncbi:hypothetical protein AB205_0010850, partial [Aquarana catesbeiana]